MFIDLIVKPCRNLPSCHLPTSEAEIMKTSILRTVLIMASLFAVTTGALAQYVWLDDKGAKQFSDQPPPPSVPKNKILKFPGKLIDSPDTSGNTDSDAPKTVKQPESAAEKEMAYKKRREESAAREKKSEEQAKSAAAKADNCKRMREYKQSLDSGQRISQTDANGNRSFLTDDKRAQETSALTQNMSDCGN